MTWVKICGMTNLADARAAVEAGADAIGLIFAPSPRRITPTRAGEIVAALPATVDKVGVFCNESAERIAQVVDTAGLTAVQLHGDEPVELVMTLRRGARQPRLRIFKTLAITNGTESAIRAFANCELLDAVLLDSVVVRAAADGSPQNVRGGTGVSFDWKRAAAFVPGLAKITRVIVAGGLTPGTVAEAVRILHPWGVDVCSGVEAARGRKNHDQVRAFVAAVRAVHQ